MSDETLRSIDPGQSAPAPEPEPKKTYPKALLSALIALYAVSVVAAVAVLWRTPPKEASAPAKPLHGGGFLSASKDKDVVAVVSITGPIYASEGGGVWARGAQAWARRLQKLAEKKEVKAIVLSIDSPGGSVGSVQELYDVIRNLRKETKKPVVAQLGDVAASGGYYLAAACDKVVSHEGTLLGSIGVIFHTSNVEGLLGKIGVKSDVIKSGKMKDIGSMTRAMTPEERALLQALIDDAYGQFVKAVADGRGMPEDKVRPLADGRIFSGAQGMSLGLVDKLGNSEVAIQLAAEMGGIQGKPKVLRDGDSLSGMLELFESRFAGLGFGGVRLPGSLQELAYTGLEYRWSR